VFLISTNINCHYQILAYIWDSHRLRYCNATCGKYSCEVLMYMYDPWSSFTWLAAMIHCLSLSNKNVITSFLLLLSHYFILLKKRTFVSQMLSSRRRLKISHYYFYQYCILSRIHTDSMHPSYLSDAVKTKMNKYTKYLVNIFCKAFILLLLTRHLWQGSDIVFGYRSSKSIKLLR
jgi:hypothetical protein